MGVDQVTINRSILVMKAPASLFACAFPSCYSTVFDLYQHMSFTEPIDAQCPQNVDFMTFLIITHDKGVEI